MTVAIEDMYIDRCIFEEYLSVHALVSIYRSTSYKKKTKIELRKNWRQYWQTIKRIGLFLLLKRATRELSCWFGNLRLKVVCHFVLELLLWLEQIGESNR